MCGRAVSPGQGDIRPLRESLLTGEADTVDKQPGDGVLSGTFVTAGDGPYVATAVGAAPIQRMIIPVGALLVVSQLPQREHSVRAVVGSMAGIVPMIPEGLVLMTSVAFALALFVAAALPQRVRRRHGAAGTG